MQRLATRIPRAGSRGGEREARVVGGVGSPTPSASDRHARDAVSASERIEAAHATAVALLYEQRKLDLDAPVQRYVPSFPREGLPITTRNSPAISPASGITKIESFS